MTGRHIRFLLRSCFGWGLHMPLSVTRRGGSLLHCPSTLTTTNAGGIISVALSLESPPPDVIRHPCPVKPGLSSPGTFRSCQPRPFILSYLLCKDGTLSQLIIGYCKSFSVVIPQITDPANIRLPITASAHELPQNRILRNIASPRQSGRK